MGENDDANQFVAFENQGLTLEKLFLKQRIFRS